MRMLSGRMHWLMVGLALLVSAQGFATKRLHGQAPLKPAAKAAKRQAEARSASFDPTMQGMPYGMPVGMMPGMSPGMPGMHPGMGGVIPAGGMMMPDAPMSMVLQGPPPMDVAYAGASSCDAMGGYGSCGGGACGGQGCSQCGDGSGCLFSGRLAGLLGPLAPYSEGGRGAQRWFDLYAGTIGLRRTSRFGNFATQLQDPTTGEFATSNILSATGISGPATLVSTDLSFDRMRYGLELLANLQTGPGANLEARYFGLNDWQADRTVRLTTPNLFSVFSLYGVSPAGGFDDTDRSFIHTMSYNSELHNGEVNYRRRWVGPFDWVQGSWLAGVRYFDLDERFGFSAVGSNTGVFVFDQLRFFNFDTVTRNQLTGFQLGGDLWVNVLPGVQFGAETKAGIFGNHAEVESQAFSNSVAGAREFLQDGRTAYLTELTASLVYRMTYSWSIKGSYNLLYVDNVALAPENFNTRDLSNAFGGGGFTINRFPFIDTDGEVFYQGWSLGAEYLF